VLIAGRCSPSLEQANQEPDHGGAVPARAIEKARAAFSNHARLQHLLSRWLERTGAPTGPAAG
jgi:hypothetical protein